MSWCCGCRLHPVQLLIVGKRCALDERLQRRLAVAVLARVRALGVVALHPDVNIGLQFIERMVELPPEGARVELVLDRLVEALADPIGLWALDPGPGVLDVLQIQVERELVAFPVATVFRSADRSGF